MLLETLGTHVRMTGEAARICPRDAALRIDEIIQAEKIVNWTTNTDVQNRMKNRIEDYLHDLKQRNRPGPDLRGDRRHPGEMPGHRPAEVCRMIENGQPDGGYLLKYGG